MRKKSLPALKASNIDSKKVALKSNKKNLSTKTISFILPVLSQPRYYTRITNIQKLGIRTQILSFERDYFPGKFSENDYISLGEVKAGYRLLRIIPILKAVRTVLKHCRSSDIIYCFDLDTLILGFIFSLFQKRRIKIAYEVGDIRPIFIKKSFLSSLLRKLEKLVIKNTSAIVTTSNAYIEEYFKSILKQHDRTFFVIENKIDPSMFHFQPTPKRFVKNSKIKIGYFGFIRCQKSWIILKHIASNYPDKFEIHIAGYQNQHIITSDESVNKNIHYYGPFTTPDDLPKLYNMVDLTWIAHAHGETNSLWARANRFYQSCFFKTPMIAQIGTQDAPDISEYNIGTCIDLLNTEITVETLLSINQESLNTWNNNLANVPEVKYVLTDEHAQLMDILFA